MQPTSVPDSDAQKPESLAFDPFDPSSPGLLLSECLDDAETLANYLKVLYRSLCYGDEVGDIYDEYGHFRSVEDVAEGGDALLASQALCILGKLRTKIRNVRQGLGGVSHD